MRYTRLVIRGCAVAVILAISFPLISPLLHAKPKPELPACCRRDGKHGCAKSSAGTDSDGIRLTAAKPPCSQFPQYKGTSVSDRTQAAPPPRTVAITLNPCVETTAQMEILYRISFSRSSQERGPPSFHRG